MTQRLADRLRLARQRQFVGRAAELGVFRSALAETQWPFQLLYVYGPGGVGKTALLQEYSRLSREAGLATHYLDARNIEATPEAFLGELRQALQLEPTTESLKALAARGRRCVLIWDTCETLAPLEAWLRDVWLPETPENVLVVMAGRIAPSPGWRAELGWQTLIRVLPLRNLDPNESRTYLTQRGLPPEQVGAVLSFTHGHPLALSLVADVFQQRPDVGAFQPETTPDVVKALLERFVQKVPSPAHRAALEACGLVRVTTEGLLAAMLGAPDAHELFEWLRGLSFIEAGPHGLFLHDLARETLSADVRWRNPDWYAELHRRARTYYVARLPRTTGPTQQQTLFDLIYLHRDNAVVRPVFEWQGGGNLLLESFREGDRPALLAMVRQHEGGASAQWAAFWLARQPQHVLVVHDDAGKPVGFMLALPLQSLSAADRESDPATRAGWSYLEQHASLRPSEIVAYFRFWMADDTYQAVSPVQSLLFVNAVRYYLTTPGLAFHFFPCAQPEFWAPVFAYADLLRLPEADYEVGGRTYGVYGHDWRVTPPSAWLNLLAEREVAQGASAENVAPRPAPALIVLSRSDFADAVRHALQDFTQPDLMRRSPLLRSRLVFDRAGADSNEAARSAALQELIRETAAGLLASPREAKLYRALEATYFKPVGTQERAAEALDLPFSTYRRHLKTGLTRLVEALWSREIGGEH
jgi:hypothetical protein